MDNRSDFGKFKNLEQDPLKERLENITIFRQQHHKLKDVISKTLIKESIGNSYFEEQALNEVNEAYALFVAINVLDITEEGKETWMSTKRTYDLKIDKIESQITASLRTKLSSAKTANEMFKVFSIFNVLFSRPRIRGAIQEYQNQLLGQVKKDIEQLKEKLIAENMKDQTLTRVRDFPRVSNRITWTK